MLTFEAELGKVHVLEDESELMLLPEPKGKRIFLDHETTGLNPYQGDRICGIGFCLEEGDAYYVPIRHTACDQNINPEVALPWFKEYINKFDKWINHNINFDHHFFWVDGVEFEEGKQTICTLQLSKLIDAEQEAHGLKPLCRDVFGLDMEDELIVEQWFKANKIKKADRCYADVPYDMLGKYGGMDVLANRFLYYKQIPLIPKDMLPLVQQEIKFTRTLFNIERRGLKIDRKKNLVDGYKAVSRMVEIVAELETMFQVEFKDHYSYRKNIICEQMGLPVVHWGKRTKNRRTGIISGGGPSFDKDALVKYAAFPEVLVDPDKVKAIDLFAEYSKLSSHRKLFMVKFEEFLDHESKLHPRYTQNIRTGRMSNSSPSVMVQTKKSKELFTPEPGMAFLDWDADQIEFRMIVTDILNPMALAAYKKDPNTDFHNWTAKAANIARKLAKLINFSLAYGAGEKKILSEISKDKEVILEIINQMHDEGLDPVGSDVQEYDRRLRRRAKDIYEAYHLALPEIKKVAKFYEDECKSKGFITNYFKRRRKIPWSYAYSAFNTRVQGGAMDYIKGRMLALDEDEYLRSLNISIMLNVHDSLLFMGPIKYMRDPKIHAYIKAKLEIVPEEFIVPLPWSGGYSENNWAEAASEKPGYDDQGNFVYGPLEFMYETAA